MKNRILIMLVSTMIILTTIAFDACDNHSVSPDDESGNLSPDSEKGTEEPGESQNIDFPCLEYYSFSSMDDFQLFCKTGSRDASLYQSGPDYETFPPFSMKNGTYIGLDSLFPSIDLSEVIVDHIEIPNDHQYSLSGKTNTSKVHFSILINYNEGQLELSTDNLIEEKIDTINKKIEENGLVRYELIYGNYYDADAPRPATENWVNTEYIWDTDGCILTYGLYQGKITGMSVRYGEYLISVGPGTVDNTEFFTDEALIPLSNMFKGGEERTEALQKIAEAVDSATGQTSKTVITPAEYNEARVLFSNVPESPKTPETEINETELPNNLETEHQITEESYPVDQVTEAIPDTRANEPNNDNANDIPSLEIYTFSRIDDFKLFCSTGSRDISMYKNGPGYGVFPLFNMKSGSYLGFDSLFPAVDMSKVIVDYIGIQSDCHYWYSGKTYPNGVPYLIEISYIDGQSVISTDKIIEEEVNTIKSRIEGYDFIYYEYIYGDYCDEVTLQPTIRIPVHTDYIWDIDDCILTCGKYKGKPVGITIRYGNYQISISTTTTDNSGFFTDEALFPLSAMFKGGKERKEALRRIVETVDSVQGQTPQAVIEPAKNRETRVIFSNIPDVSETSVDSGTYETDLPLT